jgi:hypothetical protein
MRWQCEYRDAKGRRCVNEAICRLQFSMDHPFDFVDTCADHVKEYRHVAWIQMWKGDDSDTTGKSRESVSDNAEILSNADETKASEETE